MKRAVVVLVAILLLGSTAARAVADDVAVIVNKSNVVNNLSMEKLRKIILSQELKWPTGSRIIVWMTPPGGRERVGVLKLVCGMSETDYTLHFMHSSFNGETADLPKTAGTGPLVRQLVAGWVNGFALIWASDVDDTVKVLAIDGKKPGQPGYPITVK
jgi:hypothetical protein